MTELAVILKAISNSDAISWVRKTANKVQLKEWWDLKYPTIPFQSATEILYCLKFDATPLCKYGEHKNFKQFPAGYFTACSNADCQCKKELRLQVGKSTAANRTVESIKAAKQKGKETLIARYGVSNPSHIPEVVAKIQASRAATYAVKGSEIKKKVKATTLEKYGVEHYSQSAEYQSKCLATCMAKYGVAHAIIAPEVIEKRKLTLVEKFGVDNYFKLPEMQEQINQARLEKFGYRNVGQRFVPKESLAILNDAELFKVAVTDLSFEAAARKLGTSATTISLHVAKHGIEHLTNKGVGSVDQDELSDWLESLNLKVERNNRRIIAPKELDIVIPEFKLAIEFNGIYFHSEISGAKGEDYHLQKTTLCESNGFKLIHINSIVYKNNPKLIKSLIFSNLNLNRKIHGRKCEVIQVAQLDAANFLSENSLNFSKESELYFGLTFKSELMQVIGLTKVDDWILDYCCSKQLVTVVGGMSKLLAYFSRSFNPVKLTASIDRQFFNGNSLAKVGFKKIQVTEPRRFATDYKSLFEESNSNAVDYLWDCGDSKWELTGSSGISSICFNSIV